MVHAPKTRVGRPEKAQGARGNDGQRAQGPARHAAGHTRGYTAPQLAQGCGRPPTSQDAVRGSSTELDAIELAQALAATQAARLAPARAGKGRTPWRPVTNSLSYRHITRSRPCLGNTTHVDASTEHADIAHIRRPTPARVVESRTRGEYNHLAGETGRTRAPAEVRELRQPASGLRETRWMQTRQRAIAHSHSLP